MPSLPISTPRAHVIDNFGGQVRRGCLLLPIERQFGTQKQASAAYIADQIVFFGLSLQTVLGIGADGAGVFQQIFIVNHIQNRHGGRDCCRMC
jgi:hypothetical protein